MDLQPCPAAPGDFTSDLAGRAAVTAEEFLEDSLLWSEVVYASCVLHDPPQPLASHTHTHAHTWPQPPLAYLGHSDIRLTRTVTGMPFDLGFALKPSRTVTLQRQVCVVKTSSV